MSTTTNPTVRTHVYDPDQKPELQDLCNFTKFGANFLIHSDTSYPRASDTMAHLKRELKDGVSINHESPIEDFLTEMPEDHQCYHDGYLQYLLRAWKNDCGIEVGPWHIWNIILHQICQIVKGDSDKYRTMFTSSDEKITIKFTDGAMFEIDRFIDAIREKVPVDLDAFVPKFDEAPQLYADAMYGLFADMVQDYYACMILGCSIPKVRVLGTDADWIKLDTTVAEITGLFAKHGCPLGYLNGAAKCVGEMRRSVDKPDYWKQFFYVQRCGSGSQEEIGGHVLQLLVQNSTVLTGDIPGMVCRYPFEYLVGTGEKQKDHYFIAGVMFSDVDTDGYLVPKYHKVITRKNMDLCRMSEQTSQDTRVLIEFMERTDKYTTPNSDMYRKASTKYISCDREKKIPSWEEYYKEASRFRMSPKADHEEECRKDYKQRVKDLTAHNARVRKSGGDQAKYEELMEEERVAKLPKHGNFWLNQKGVTEIEGNCYVYMECISHDEWIKFLKAQADDVAFILKNCEVIFDFIFNNHQDLFTERLLKMYNPQILLAYVAYVVENEETLQFDPKEWRHCWSSYDPKNKAGFDLLTTLVFELVNKIDDQRIGHEITKHLCRELFTKVDAAPILAKCCDVIAWCVGKKMERFDRDIKRADDPEENQTRLDCYEKMRNCSSELDEIRGDVRRYRLVLEAVGSDEDPYDVVNAEFCKQLGQDATPLTAEHVHRVWEHSLVSRTVFNTLTDIDHHGFYNLVSGKDVVRQADGTYTMHIARPEMKDGKYPRAREFNKLKPEHLEQIRDNVAKKGCTITVTTDPLGEVVVME